MKKRILAMLMLFVCLILCACNDEDKSAETAGTKDEKTVQNGYTSAEENELIGAWYSDAEGVVVIFSELGDMQSYMIEQDSDGNSTVSSLIEKYNLVDGNQIETYDLHGEFNVAYQYSIVKDVLTLTFDSENEYICFDKVKRSTTSENPLVGQWKLLSRDYATWPSYRYQKYDVTFYADGTYVSKHEDYVTGEEMVKNGNYSVIHDGRTLEMGVTIGFYWDFEFLCDDVMLVTVDNSQIIYIAQ